MRDGAGLRAVKLVARLWYLGELSVRRRLMGLRQPPRYVLGGACQRCAKCCEAPKIPVGWVLWNVAPLRRLFLMWQAFVNGFELVKRDREGRMFVFRCSHFDPVARSCDSYDSRPGMCRDYPRGLFDQAWPELFDECGYRPIDRQGEGLERALDAASMDPATRQLLKKKLYLK